MHGIVRKRLQYANQVINSTQNISSNSVFINEWLYQYTRTEDRKTDMCFAYSLSRTSLEPGIPIMLD